MLPLHLKPFGPAYPFSPAQQAGLFEFIDAITDAIADISIELPATFFPPLHISRMHDDGAGKPGVIRIKDANDVTVFDSAECVKTISNWGDYYVIQWIGTSGASVGSLCRLVGRSAVHLTINSAWVTTSALRDVFTVTVSYSTPYSLPTYANSGATFDGLILDPMTATVRPPRLDSVTVGTETITDATINISPGYNAAWRSVAAPQRAGAIPNSKIYVDLLGGGGLGFPPDCNSTSPLLRYLGGVGADQYGGIRLSATDCYSAYVSAPIVNDVAEPPAATITLRNDCKPCYECSAFESVYTAMRVMNDRLLVLGGRGDAINNTYNLMRARWLKEKACRESKPVRVMLLGSDAGGGNTWVTAVVTFGNSAGTCLGRVGINLHWNLSAGVSIPSLDITQTRRYLAQAGRPQPYTLGGAWPDYTGSWDYVPAGNAVRVKAVFLFPAAAAGSWVQLTATPFINDAPPNADQSWTDTLVLGIPS